MLMLIYDFNLLGYFFLVTILATIQIAFLTIIFLVIEYSYISNLSLKI